MAAAVQGDEGLLGAPAPGVDGAGEAFLPVPVSPRISTGVSVSATCRARNATSRITGFGSSRGCRGLAAELGLEKLGVLMVLPVKALEGRLLFAVVDGEGEHPARRPRRGSPPRPGRARRPAVEGGTPKERCSGEGGTTMQEWPGAAVQHAVEGIAVAVLVVVLGVGPGPAGLEGLAQRRKVRQREDVTGDALRGEGTPAARTTSRPPSRTKRVARSYKHRRARGRRARGAGCRRSLRQGSRAECGDELGQGRGSGRSPESPWALPRMRITRPLFR